MRARSSFSCALAFLGIVMLWALGAESSSNRIDLSPQLRAGQVISYMIRYDSERKVKTESAVAAPMAPDSARVDAHGLLRVEVADAGAPGSRSVAHLRTQFITLNSDTHLHVPEYSQGESLTQRIDPQGKTVEFTLLPDGRTDNVKGLDTLFPEQQQLWSEWVARFAATAILPARGAKLGEHWETEEPEVSPTPIAGLVWARRAKYVRDERCRVMMLTVTGEVVPSNQAPQTCAVILTAATLKQSSSSKEATPEDYKLHDLRTMGTARGTNEIICYVSRSTGLVVRATEDAKQTMDVVVAKADGSNRVHYNIDAHSHGQVLLVAESALRPAGPAGPPK